MKLEEVRTSYNKRAGATCARCDREMQVGTIVGFDPTHDAWVHLSHLVNRKTRIYRATEESVCQRCYLTHPPGDCE